MFACISMFKNPSLETSMGLHAMTHAFQDAKKRHQMNFVERYFDQTYNSSACKFVFSNMRKSSSLCCCQFMLRILI